VVDMEIPVKNLAAIIVSKASIMKWSRNRVIIYVPAKIQRVLKKYMGKKLNLIIFVLEEAN